MEKRSVPAMSGAVTSYTHSNGKIGVLVEVTCHSEFVARSDEFRELIRDLALQIAAASPKYIRKEDVPAEQAEQQNNTSDAATGIETHFEEVCPYHQPFIKDNSITISQLIIGYAAKLCENISVTRFARFAFGEPGVIVASSRGDEQQPGGDPAGVIAYPPITEIEERCCRG